MSSRFRLIFFNDAYEIESRHAEPVGGVARMTGAIRRLQSDGVPSLVLFGGDLFSPSTLSIFDKGKHMVSVVNLLGIDAACVGNHDEDFGLATLARWIEMTPNCCWLLANMTDPSTGVPLGGAKKSVLLERAGVKVGVIGLGSHDWTQTLAVPIPLHFEDMVAVGDAQAKLLRAQGADIIVVLAHCRLPDLQMLAEKLADCDAVLAGHDHFLHRAIVNNRPTMIADNDFKAVGVVDLELDANRRVTGVAALRHVVIDSSVPEDAPMRALVNSIVDDSRGKLAKRIGWTAVDLDCTVKSCRSGESNFGNWVADLCRIKTGADVCLFNGGTVRSDSVVPSGPFTIGDLLRVLPFQDPVVVISVSGATLLKALEAGVSKFPTLDGCWPQISGVRIEVDPARPPGQRIVSARLTQPDRPIDLTRDYSLATKSFLADGADGYDCLKGSHFIIDEEAAVFLKNHIRSFFRQLDILNGWKRQTFAKGVTGVAHAVQRFKVYGTRFRSRRQSPDAAAAPAAVPAAHEAHVTHAALHRTDLAAHDLPLLSISPVVDGRVRVLDDLGALDREFATSSRSDLLREISRLRHLVASKQH